MDEETCREIAAFTLITPLYGYALPEIRTTLCLVHDVIHPHNSDNMLLEWQMDLDGCYLSKCGVRVPAGMIANIAGANKN